MKRTNKDSLCLPLVVKTACALAMSCILPAAYGGESASQKQLFALDSGLIPRPGVFVEVKDGHFTYGGKRLRLWGAGGHVPNVGPGQPRGVSLELSVKRLRQMGFNAFRLWGVRNFCDPESAKKGEFTTYAKGDGSEFDLFDRFFGLCKESGMFLVLPVAHYYPFGLQELVRGSKEYTNGRLLLEEGSFLAPGPDWNGWKAAVLESGFVMDHVKFFDERLLRLYERQIVAFLNHKNPYTGLRYAEDEAIAMLSLDNENAAIPLILERGIGEWPEYFQKEILAQWNIWLKRKYKDETALLAAYQKLGEGEAWGHLGWHPLLRERKDYPGARAADLVEFVLSRAEAYYGHLRKVIREQAPPGIGANVVPIAHNHQTRSNIPWLYSQQVGGAISSPAYYSYTLRSLLGLPPNQYSLEDMTVEGTPTLLYEVNAGTPNPYRAEFPFRVAALACWQDWDAVFMHYWNHYGKEGGGDDQWTQRGINYPLVNEPYANLATASDPVLTASYAMAGQIFLRGLLSPASDPVRVGVRPKDVLGFSYWNGLSIRDLTYARGTRVVFTEEKLSRPAVNLKDGQAVASGSEILWDWPNERLILDAPGVKAYVGKVDGLHRFQGGITLSGINVPFVVWALASEDGRPLVGEDASSRMLLLAVGDAQNPGFSMKMPPGDFSTLVHSHPKDQAVFITNHGKGPSIQQKVGYTLSFPTQLTGSLTSFNFSLHAQDSWNLEDSNVLEIPPQAAWMSQVEIAKRGEAAREVVSDARPTDPPLLALSSPASAQDKPERKNSKGPELPAPIPSLDLPWGIAYHLAHKTLRDSWIVYNDVTKEDQSPSADASITMRGAEIWFGLPATVVFGFQNGGLVRITATFVPPPDWDQAVAELTKQWKREPENNRRFTTGSDTSQARWQIPSTSGNGTLDISLSEVQGIGTLTFDSTQTRK